MNQIDLPKLFVIVEYYKFKSFLPLLNFYSVKLVQMRSFQVQTLGIMTFHRVCLEITHLVTRGYQSPIIVAKTLILAS
jgi:hypothetical protein